MKVAGRRGTWPPAEALAPAPGRRRLLALAATLAAGSAAPRAARAQDPNPDGSVEIEEARIGIGALSGTIGGGRLRFQGEEYRFAVRGLTAGGVGVSTLQAQGEVFRMARLEQFPGTYEQTGTEEFDGEDGRLTVLFLQNEAGVRLRLRATRSGILLQIATGGVAIAWRN